MTLLPTALRRRAYTLVELMIVVAIIGILAAGFGGGVRRGRLTAMGELQRERALILLEYRATGLSQGRPDDPAVLGELQANLPHCRITEASDGPTTTLTVDWKDPVGNMATRSLTIFTKGGGR